MGHVRWVGTNKGVSYSVSRTLLDADVHLWNILDAYEHTLATTSQSPPSPHIKDSSDFPSYVCDYSLYINAAKKFYYSAKEADTNISPLLYYYFLTNIVKAGLKACEIKDWYRQDDEFYLDNSLKILHGLTTCSPPDKTGDIWKDLKDARICVYTNKNSLFSRFHKFYFKSMYFGIGAPKLKEGRLCIQVPTLLAYLQSIKVAAANTILPKLRFKMLKSDVRILMNMGERRFLSVVRIIDDHKSEDFLQHKSSFKGFHKEYMPTKIPPGELKRIYGEVSGKWDAHSQDHYTYYQTKNTAQATPMNEIGDVNVQLTKALGGRLQFNYMNMGTFFIALPHKHDENLRLNETVAIYMLMFYLGYLVRYDPQFLEKLSSNTLTRSLLDIFIQSAPLTILHDLTCCITSTNHIILPPQ